MVIVLGILDPLAYVSVLRLTKSNDIPLIFIYEKGTLVSREERNKCDPTEFVTHYSKLS